jgi:hypothetical protein
LWININEQEKTATIIVQHVNKMSASGGGQFSALFLVTFSLLKAPQNTKI